MFHTNLWLFLEYHPHKIQPSFQFICAYIFHHNTSTGIFRSWWFLRWDKKQVTGNFEFFVMRFLKKKQECDTSEMFKINQWNGSRDNGSVVIWGRENITWNGLVLKNWNLFQDYESVTDWKPLDSIMWTRVFAVRLIQDFGKFRAIAATEVANYVLNIDDREGGVSNYLSGK